MLTLDSYTTSCICFCCEAMPLLLPLQTLLVYPIYFFIIVLFIYGVWRLGERGWQHVSEIM